MVGHLERPTMTPSRWHAERRKRIIRDHPTVALLWGPVPCTSVIILGLVILQMLLAVLADRLGVTGALILALVVGAPMAHALGAGIHECAHDLVFSKKWANKLLSIVANLPLLFPAAIDFRSKHLTHHRRLGLDGEDTQKPSAREAQLAGDSPIRRLAWLTAGPAFFHSGEPNPNVRLWLAANVSINLLYSSALLWLSPVGLLYLFISPLLTFGLHPIGIRRFGEHAVLSPSQPTNSYYGLWSRLAFNVGMHVEHHDFPNIPWCKLPQLRTEAKEFYQSLHTIPSWTSLFLSFLTRKQLGVSNYVGPELVRGVAWPAASAQAWTGPEKQSYELEAAAAAASLSTEQPAPAAPR